MENNKSNINIDTYLGDSHNFGKKVTRIRRNKIYKPRCIYWEYLLLSDSEFRKDLNLLFKKNNIISSFQAIPILEVSLNNDFFISGEIEEFIETKVEYLTEKESASLGSTIAMLHSFGIIDQHFENFMYARRNDIFLFAPVDIEAIHYDAALLSQSYIVSGKNSEEKTSGLYKIKKILCSNKNNRLAFIESYIETVQLIIKKWNYISELFLKDPQVLTAPIRVILRPTQDYYGILNKTIKKNDLQYPLLEEESKQLLRKDIPYFFRYLGSDEVFWLSEPNTKSTVNIDRITNHTQLLKTRIAKNSLITPRPKGEFLLKYSLNEILQFVDIKKSIEILKSDKTKIAFKDNHVYISYNNELNIHMGRRV